MTSRIPRFLVALALLVGLASPAWSQSAVPTSDVFGNVAVSSTNAYRGFKISLYNTSQASCQLIWTGTPTGTFIIQVSNKPAPVESTDTDWTTLSLAVAITQPAGSASNDFVDLSTLPARWARPKYTNASGTGNIQAWCTAKGG